MLKKLRLRFVGINMAIVLVILCTISACCCTPRTRLSSGNPWI